MRRPVAALALAALIGVAAPAAGVGGDPALEALRSDDAYVSPRVLGPAAAAEEATLRSNAAALREAGRPVKLAVVIGPVGAPSLAVYAERLAVRLDHDGTVIVTRRNGAVAVATPVARADITARVAAADLEAVANPVERLVQASRIAAVPVEPDEPDVEWAGLALLAVALAGGGWAAAIGMGRAGRVGRRDLSEARAVARVHLDALRARAGSLARRPDLPEEARARVEGALGTYADVVGALQAARTTEEVTDLVPRIDGALAGLAEVGAEVGAPFPADRPFEGLCAADPGHGPATAEGPVIGIDGPAPVCTACREAADGGSPPRRRLLPREGRPVPFDETALPEPGPS
ncbi:MAG: hypothetical protein AB7V62_14630 [Thermoleophilia bacterium]